MSWVSEALKELSEGRIAQVRPIGGSMRGRIESGQLVTIQPAKPSDIAVNDVVFIKWKGNYILHIVKEIKEDQLLIGNNIGKINGWAKSQDIIGKVTAVSE
jgi:hypothetical protein